MAVRLLLPVMLLAVLLGAAALYSDALLLIGGAPVFVQSANLTLGDLVLPLTWTAIHLTNRRYGANYAVGQTVGGLVIVALVALVNPYGVDGSVGITPALSSRALMAFAMSFLLANSVAIILFDAVRGPQWWRAPLIGSFAASLVFSLVYYPMAFAGEDAGWANSALIHFALFIGESLLLLAPYGLLRPAMRPLHGMNGY